MTTAPDSARAIGFADLGLRHELLHALTDLGYEEPTPIQREAIPPLLAGRDLLGQAATGTGKTAAFALPVLQRLAEEDRGSDPGALVLTPTRELAVQVSQAFHRYGRELEVRVVPIYGGQPIGRQLQALDRGVDIVVATPGRALDHIGRRTLRLHDIGIVVLDEADEMFDMGFAEEIEEILDQIGEDRQTVMFSATMPPQIDRVARKQLRDPVRVALGLEAGTGEEPPLVRQIAYMVARPHKQAAIGRILDLESPAAALVFCRTREEVDRLAESLNGRGHRAEALHGGMGQEQRDRVMRRLRAGSVDLVVATDVAARGLDVEQLTHVVNYNVPSAPEDYVHRIGRVGRAGREGTAITLTEPREHRMIKAIERLTKRRIAVERVPTAADLFAHRMELTRAALRETLLGDDFDRFRAVVEPLADEFDVMDVALAAVRLAHESSVGSADEAEIPEVAERAAGRGRPARHDGTVRVFIGMGRSAGVRPQDLVGAIAGETRLSGRDIGAIDIAERFSLVEVPEPEADEVITALRHTTIKRRKATVRRDREPYRRGDLAIIAFQGRLSPWP
ncbi:DEAD/DEAH box helicase [Glycomyces halotolerans]